LKHRAKPPRLGLVLMALVTLALLTLPVAASKYGAVGTASPGARVAKWGPSLTYTVAVKTVLFDKRASTATVTWTGPPQITMNNSATEVAAKYSRLLRLQRTGGNLPVGTATGDICTSATQSWSSTFAPLAASGNATDAANVVFRKDYVRVINGASPVKYTNQSVGDNASGNNQTWGAGAMTAQNDRRVNVQFYETVEYCWEAVQVD